MENENKILKEIQQSNKAVLSLIANQNKINVIHFDSLSTQIGSIKGDVSGIHGEIKNINKTLEIITGKIARIELATLENRVDMQGLNANLKRIAHNHETRIIRLENGIAI